VAGKWLGDWTVFAAGISNLALYQAELSSDVFKIYGMANKGLLPKALGVRSRHGTPTYSIIVCTMVVICFSTSHFDRLIEMLNFNYAIALLMEYAAFIKLRLTRPDIPRPYKVPLGTTGCIIVLIPTVVGTIIVMLLASYTTMIMGILSVVASTAFYKVFEKRILETYTQQQQHAQEHQMEEVPLDDDDGDMELI